LLYYLLQQGAPATAAHAQEGEPATTGQSEARAGALALIFRHHGQKRQEGQEGQEGQKGEGRR